MTQRTPPVRLCPAGCLDTGQRGKRILRLAGGKDSRFNGGMPEFTRRRFHEAREETWHIYYGDGARRWRSDQAIQPKTARLRFR